MTFSQAQTEFKIRYYRWAVSEFEREIEGSFPNLRLFSTGPAWEVCQFMGGLTSSMRLVLAHSLLKRFHPAAVEALKESYLPEEKLLRGQLDVFRHQVISTVESELSERRRAGERIKFINKRRALRVILQRFQNSFADKYIKADCVLTGDPSLELQTKCLGGWTISTHFWFGRSESLLDYCHTISSDASVERQGHQGPYTDRLVIGSLISFCEWLGICSQTQWEYLREEEELQRACDTALNFCKYFFDVAPNLLAGLEVEAMAWP